MKKLDMKQLEEIRDWVLGREDPKEGALFIFSWAVGVASAAGFKLSELVEIIGKPLVEPRPIAERDPVAVIDQVLAVVPEGEAEFRERLTKIKDEAIAAPPKNQGALWLAIGDAFFNRFGMGPPSSGWGPPGVAYRPRSAGAVMRDITVVIPKVLEVIPAEEDYLRTSFERILKRAHQNARYQPPSFYWEQGAHVLYERFGEHPPDEEWFRELQRIWMGRDQAEPVEVGTTLPPRADVVTATDWKLMAAIVVLVILGIAVYFKAQHP